MKVICCGSFDPITKGHEDLIRRAARLFDEVVVVVAKNPDKQYLFSAPQRAELCRKTVAELQNVTVAEYDGVIVDYARQIGASALVKGIRNGSDAEYELQMATVNRLVAPEIETVVLPSKPEYAALSSSYVKTFIRYQKAFDDLVPAVIRDDIKKMIERMESHG